MPVGSGRGSTLRLTEYADAHKGWRKLRGLFVPMLSLFIAYSCQPYYEEDDEEDNDNGDGEGDGHSDDMGRRMRRRRGGGGGGAGPSVWLHS